MKLSHLFTPITINNMTLKNRSVMPPMGTGYANMDNTPSERLIEYLARRAQGGTALIITEICAVDPRGKGFPNQLGAWSDEFIPHLAKIPQAVHREGAMSALQLHHAGRETFESAAGAIPEAPSPIPSVILYQPCEEMSLARITEMIDAFGKAALRAKKAGFDAVEIHGAHGYLLNQFLSPFSNQRADRYGGSEKNRSRFVLEIVEAVRGGVGPDFPIIIRVSTDELVRGGYDLNFMKWLAPQLVSAGVNAIHASVGVYSTPGQLSIASMDTEEGFNLFRARAIKEVTGVPVIGVGRVSLEMAEKALAAGDADLIAFGRQHLADPDFIGKAREGKFEDIRMCVACNQGCIERLSFEMKSATCTFNPECGRESKGLPKADTRKKVWVIGAGPAGLSAAMYAVQRGYEVEVFEKRAVAGGQIQSASRPPHKEAFMDWVDWSLRQLKKHDVEIHYNQEITREDLKNVHPDAVVLASGAYPCAASIPGIESDHVFDARDVLEGKVKLASPAVILGAGYVGMETADYLIARDIDVIVLEMLASPPVSKLKAHGYWLHKRIRQAGGRMMFGATVTGIENTTVNYMQNDEKRTEPASMIVTAMGAKSDNALEVVLRELGIECRIIGDAASPRRLLEAIHEGYKAAGEI